MVFAKPQDLSSSMFIPNVQVCPSMSKWHTIPPHGEFSPFSLFQSVSRLFRRTPIPTGSTKAPYLPYRRSHNCSDFKRGKKHRISQTISDSRKANPKHVWLEISWKLAKTPTKSICKSQFHRVRHFDVGNCTWPWPKGPKVHALVPSPKKFMISGGFTQKKIKKKDRHQRRHLKHYKVQNQISEFQIIHDTSRWQSHWWQIFSDPSVSSLSSPAPVGMDPSQPSCALRWPAQDWPVHRSENVGPFAQRQRSRGPRACVLMHRVIEDDYQDRCTLRM